MINLRTSMTAVLAMGGSALCIGTAVRADTDAPALDEVIVTAQRLAEPLSRVPLAISALTYEQLSDRNYVGLEDFKGAIPGLQVNNYIGEARVNIRGIGTNSLSFGVDPQVAFSLNGVYSTIFSADQAFLDVDRIEALRGPQGTLYGRNATGGAINVISKRPTDEFDASVQLKVGNYREIAPELILSGPIVGDKLLGRLAMSSEDHQGYSRNLADGRDYDDAHTRTIRGTLVFNATDTLSITLIGDYHNETDGDYAEHLLGKSPGFPVITGVAVGGTSVPLNANGQAIDPRLLSINTQPLNHRHSAGVVDEIDLKITDSSVFKSISAYRNEGLSLTQDFDSTTAVFPSTVPGKDFVAYEGSQQFSQEFQYSIDKQWYTWVSGLYFLHDHVDPAYYWLGVAPAPASFPVRVGGELTTDAYAGYTQATLKPVDKLSLTAGLRYSTEKRSADSLEELPALGATVTDAGTTKFHDISPKFTGAYQWNEKLMSYVTVAKGFESGGYDVSAQPPLAPFQQETVWDYEAGTKYRASWVSADLSVFHYNYKNLQVAQIVDGLPRTTNAATSKIDGVELQGTLKPTKQFEITTALAYLNARFTKFTEPDTLTGKLDDLAGNQLPGSTKYSSNIFAQYTIPVGNDQLSLSGEWNWHDRLYFTEFNSNQVSQGPVSTINAALRYTSGQGGHWWVEAYGKNLTNELILSQAWITGAGFGSMVLGQIAPPRTYGLTLHYSLK